LLALSSGGFYSIGCISLLLEGFTLPGSYLEDGILIAKATHRVNRGEQMAGVIWRLIDLGRKINLRRSLVALKTPARVWQDARMIGRGKLGQAADLACARSSGAYGRV
jgi:hypothetical protein